MKQKSLLTVEEVKHVAKLAKLNLTDKQIKNFSQQLSQVISYMSKIQKLETNSVIETSQVTRLENVFREDLVEKERMLRQKEVLANSKRNYKGYFVTEAVFEE